MTTAVRALHIVGGDPVRPAGQEARSGRKGIGQYLLRPRVFANEIAQAGTERKSGAEPWTSGGHARVRAARGLLVG